MEINNDTEVFYAVGGGIWKGTRKAIHAKGLKIDPLSQDFCPHQWLDESVCRSRADAQISVPAPEHSLSHILGNWL
jgi:hypothetical protein